MNDLLAPRLLPLERVIVFTLLGIRLLDAATGGPITDGLSVRARPPSAPDQVARAEPTWAGVYAFHRLPGLRHLVYPDEPVLGRASSPETRRYVVDVRDASGRFVPVAFEADAPYEGFFSLGLNGSPPADAAPGFYLFPAVTRSPAAALAVVRATLVDRASGAPAAHAVLELTLPNGGREFGLADDEGRVVATFAYPRFAPTVLSPPQSADAAREPAGWTLTARVRYQPGAQISLLPDLPPDFVSLFGQSDAPIWATAAGPPAGALDVGLVFGQEVVLRTDEEPRLLVG